MPSKFNVYKSSAGSGKTFTLTKEYLKIALREPKTKFSSILAITFTVKATNEMKARILETCHAFSKFSQRELTGTSKSLLEALVIDPEFPFSENQIQENAKILYKKILHNYSDFGVSTIDSFSQRLLRSFAFELKLPINFEVELDQDKVIELITNRLLEKIGQDDAITKLLTDVFLTRLTEKDSISIRDDIEKSAKEMLNEKSMDALELFRKKQLKVSDFVALLKSISQLFFVEKTKLEGMGNRALKLIEENGLQLSNFSGGKSRGVANYFKYIAEGKLENATDTFKKTLNGEKSWYAKKTEQSIKDRIDSIASELETIGQDILDVFPQIILKEQVRNELAKMALITELNQLYYSYRNQENIILISEFNQLIAQEVKGQPAPFIFEKVGELYDHVLIDEFQDTSVMQWQNMLPMLEESLSSENFNENLVVGDSKQAIYRWRGGETRQLSELPKLIGSEDDPILHDKEIQLRHYYKEHPLTTNFRSRETVIEFNNQLFDSLKAHKECVYRNVFEGHKQNVYKKGSGGWVTITAFEDSAYRASVEEKEEKKEERLAEMVQIIKAAVNRGYSPDDIAILNRGNKENQWVAEALAEASIPFSSKESLRLRRSPIVRLFPALIALMRQPSDHVLQARVANALLDLQLLPNPSRHALHTHIAATPHHTFRQFAQWINSLNLQLDLATLDTAELLLIWESLVGFLPKEKRKTAYISFFRDELWNFISKNGNNIDAFLDWWEEKQNKLFIKSSDQAQGVQIMTIHKSKGLEFEIVIMPFTDWDFSIKSISEYQWLPAPFPELGKVEQVLLPLKSALKHTSLSPFYEEMVNATFLDNLNLLYVATTRAVSELHILSTDKGASKAVNKANHLIHYFMKENGGGQHFEQGTPTTPTTKEEEQEQFPFQLKTAQSTNAIEGLALKNKAAVIWNDDVQDKIAFGDTVHQLLAETKTPDDLITSLEKARARGWVNEAELPVVQELLEKVVRHKELKPYFDGSKNLYSEQPIVLPNGDQFVPDRMLINQESKTVKLLDFKTGAGKAKHEQQVKQYAQLLHEMGYSIEELLLVYIDPFELKRL